MKKNILSAIIIILSFLPGSIYCQDNNDWNIYISRHGFSIMYPDNWYLDSSIENYDILTLANEQGGNHFCITSYDMNNVKNPGLPLNSNEIKIEIWIILNDYLDKFPWIPPSDKIIRDQKISLPDGNARRILFSLSDNLKDYLTLDIYYETSVFFVKFSCYPYDSQYTSYFDEIIKTFRLVY
jgi:hypothetical protein